MYLYGIYYLNYTSSEFSLFGVCLFRIHLSCLFFFGIYFSAFCFSEFTSPGLFFEFASPGLFSEFTSPDFVFSGIYLSGVSLFEIYLSGICFFRNLPFRSLYFRKLTLRIFFSEFTSLKFVSEFTSPEFVISEFAYPSKDESHIKESDRAWRIRFNI